MIFERFGARIQEGVRSRLRRYFLSKCATVSLVSIMGPCAGELLPELMMVEVCSQDLIPENGNKR
jgi:hypothetical protein